MSSPERSVILSPDAQDDLADILVHTWQAWGEAQRDRYDAVLARAIADLARFSEMGAQRLDRFPGCRARGVEQHVLYYRILGDTVEIVRILHQRADPARHLHP